MSPEQSHLKKPLTRLICSKAHKKEKPFECYKCRESFSLKSDLLTHLSTCTCDLSGKTCSQRHFLKRHLQKEKPFECDVCCKTFSRKSALQEHLLTHTKEKPFECYVCCKSFLNKSTLQEHLRIHTNGKPFSCDICSQSFSYQSNLNRHLLVHTSEKPFSCNICNKTFYVKSTFKRHEWSHAKDKEKPFACDICGKTFSYKAGHRRVVFGEESATRCGCSPGAFIESALPGGVAFSANSAGTCEVTMEKIESLLLEEEALALHLLSKKLKKKNRRFWTQKIV